MSFKNVKIIFKIISKLKKKLNFLNKSSNLEKIYKLSPESKN